MTESPEHITEDEIPQISELFKGIFTIEDLKFLDFPVQPKSKINILLKLLNTWITFEQIGRDEEKAKFSKGKSVVFPVSPTALVMLLIELEIDNEVVAFAVLQITESIKTLEDKNFDIKGWIPLEHIDDSNTLIAQVKVNFIISKIGLCLADQPADEGAEKKKVRPASTEEKKDDVLVFRTNETDPDAGGVVLELRAPRKKKLVLPPYHEDVGTQTDRLKKPNKGKTKKSKGKVKK